ARVSGIGRGRAASSAHRQNAGHADALTRMGNPLEIVTFGVPTRSGDGRLYTRYPQGNAPNSAGSGQGLGATAIASASSGSAQGGGSSGDLVHGATFTVTGSGFG